MPSDIRFKDNSVEVEAVDLEMDGGAERRRGRAGVRRALVHGFNDELVLNWNGDYTGGVRTGSRLEVGGPLRVTGELDVDQGAEIKGTLQVQGTVTLGNTQNAGKLNVTDPHGMLMIQGGVLLMKALQGNQKPVFSLNPSSLEGWPGGLQSGLLGPHLDVLAELKKMRQEVDVLKQGASGRPRIVTGETKPEQWQAYGNGSGLYVDVDVSQAGFRAVPTYVTSLYGRAQHWSITGANSIYNASTRGFRVYLRWANQAPLAPETARTHGWYLRWAAIEEG